MLESGWGVGSGQSLFQTASTCVQIVWGCFSFMKVDRGYGTEYEGAVVAAVHYLIARPNKLNALKLALFRQGLPNLVNVAATVLVFCVAIYMQGIKKNITVAHRSGGSQTQRPFPIKLLYAGSAPMMIIQQITHMVYMFSQALWRRSGNNIVTSILGTYYEDERRPGQIYPIGGLVWLMMPLHSIRTVIFQPLRTIIHSAIIIFLSGYISKVWVDFSGESAHEQATQLNSNQYFIKGFRPDSTEAELNRYIPTAAVTGGVILGALSIVADALGTLGSGSGLLMAASSLIKVIEELTKEYFGAK